MDPYVWLAGSLVPFSEAKIGVSDLACLRGFGIYEGLAAHDGEPFHFHDHWLRFERSARALGLALPETEEETLEAMRTVVRANAPTGRALVRMILTGGRADGTIVHVKGREELYILAEPMRPFPAEWYTHGAHTITHPHKRPYPEFKTIYYIEAVMLQPKLAEAHAAEAIYVSGGNVLECTGSNIFAVKDGALITPKDDMLHGITRKVVLELAKEADLPAEERVLTLAELFDADEVFITSSFKDIVPVRSVDEHAIGNGEPGPLTKDLMARFEKLI